MKGKWIIFAVLALFIIGCDQKPAIKKENKNGDWLSEGSVDERFAKVSKQLRGFDTAMVEVGYRYVELFWAGREQNWDYANYLTEKIEVAIRNGVERRPKRGSSAQMIFPSLEELKKSVSEKNIRKFNQSYSRLTITCNACHHDEKVNFIHVAAPKHRLSPIVWSGSGHEKADK